MTDENAPARIKVIFDIKESLGSPGTETMWAEQVREGEYKLLNSPFFAYGVSFGDVVKTTQNEGEVRDFSEVVHRSGHSTYRLHLKGGRTVNHSEFVRLWSGIAEKGASYENANDRLVAVDVPPDAEISGIYKIFETGEADGIWEFEESHPATRS